jgi:excisionase family DNA binding protein
MSGAPENACSVGSRAARKSELPSAPRVSTRRGQREPGLTARNVMTAREVAELLDVPVSTVHHWARGGSVPSRSIGRRRLFERPKIESLLRSQRD